MLTAVCPWVRQERLEYTKTLRDDVAAIDDLAGEVLSPMPWLWVDWVQWVYACRGGNSDERGEGIRALTVEVHAGHHGGQRGLS